MSGLPEIMTQPQPPPRLYRGDTLIGIIDLDPANHDFPWFAGIFQPVDDFEIVRPLFDRELELLNNTSNEDSEMDARDAAWEAISQPGLRIVSADGNEFTKDPLIHIEGTKAWWR